MGLDLVTHKFRKERGTQTAVLESVIPYARLANGTDAVIFLQNGQCYGAGGEFIKEENIPGWAFEQMQKMNPVVLKEIGWYEKIKAAQEILGDDTKKIVKEKTDDDPTKKKGKTYICQQCNQEVEKTHRLAHTMKHRREEEAAKQAAVED